MRCFTSTSIENRILPAVANLQENIRIDDNLAFKKDGYRRLVEGSVSMLIRLAWA